MALDLGSSGSVSGGQYYLFGFDTILRWLYGLDYDFRLDDLAADPGAFLRFYGRSESAEGLFELR